MTPDAKSTVCFSAGIICVMGALNAVFADHAFPWTTIAWLLGACASFALMGFYELKDVPEIELEELGEPSGDPKTEKDYLIEKIRNDHRENK